MEAPTQQVAKEFMTVRVSGILGGVGLGGPRDAQQCEEDAMTVKGELGQQVLEAVQGLGARMDDMGARMDHMGTRMDRLEMWMERLGAEFIRSKGELKEEIQGVRTELKTEIQSVRTELKAEIQGVRTELKAEIKAEVQGLRTELRAEMQEGFQQVNHRIDRLNDTMAMMGSALHRTNERVEGLDARVRVLEERQPHL
jgi:archaellum component FlaC